MSGAAMREVSVRLGKRSYRVLVGNGLIERAGSELGRLEELGRPLLVSDTTVAPLYAERVARGIAEAGLAEPIRVDLPAGEPHKTVASLESIYDAALDGGIDRRAFVVAVGGGVVGDVAGFAAATLLRGIRCVMVPTTLLAQVDSSVGGKTGVNRRQGKNLVGAFHQPSLVLADPATLETLPQREYRAGLAEVVKMAVILDEGLFGRLEQAAGALRARKREVLADVIARCVELKAMVVEKDERESGLRRILNFGHTVGHAIEQVTGYRRYLHGEAVAIGMVAAARVSRRLDLCDASLVTRIEGLLDRLGLPTAIPVELDDAELELAIKRDKKMADETIAFVGSAAIGSYRQLPIEPSQVRAWMRGEE